MPARPILKAPGKDRLCGPSPGSVREAPSQANRLPHSGGGRRYRTSLRLRNSTSWPVRSFGSLPGPSGGGCPVRNRSVANGGQAPFSCPRRRLATAVESLLAMKAAESPHQRVAALTTCPVCGTAPPQWRRDGRLLHCQACGWEEAYVSDRSRRRYLIGAAILLALLLGVLLWQVTSWAPFGSEALWLRAKNSLGLASVEELFELGGICNSLGRYDCSVSVFRRLLRSRPDDARVVGNLALALTRTEAHDAALPYYERYLKLGGGAVDTFHGYATRLRALGQKPESIEWYYRALQADPSFLDVTRDLVELLVQQDRHIEALSVIGGFVRRLPNYRPYWNGRITAIDAALSRTQSTRAPAKTVLEIPASGDHHFIPIRLSRTGPYEFFMVDSGASLLSLSPEAVQETGARPRLAGQVVTLRTASGTVVGDAVLLPEIQIGSLWLEDVEGVVCDGCPPLLGQSVLRRFDLRTTRRHSVEFLILTLR